MNERKLQQRRCSVEGCERPWKAKGLCGTHHQRLRATGRLDLVSRRKHCSIEECHRFAYGGGLCRMHYDRLRRTGQIGKPECAHNHLRIADKGSIEQVLLKYRIINLNGCWEWTRCKVQGYGWMWLGEDGFKVSRVSAYVFWDFDLQSEKHILHTCDNRACFNPDHLYEGNDHDNHLDRINRRRLIVGKRGFESGLR